MPLSNVEPVVLRTCAITLVVAAATATDKSRDVPVDVIVTEPSVDVIAPIAPRLVNASAAVVAPVPPLVIAKVPPRVNVPLVVIGLPVNVKPVVPPEAATLVTVPPPSRIHSNAVAVELRPKRLFALPVYEGNKFLIASAAFVASVPPEAIGTVAKEMVLPTIVIGAVAV